MAFDPLANFVKSNIQTAPSPATTGTTLTITSGDVVAQSIPTAAAFNAIVWPVGSQPTVLNAEIVRMTWTSGDSFTIARHQEGTTARTIVVGDQIMLGVTKKTLTDIEDAITALQTSGFSADGGAPGTSFTGVLKIDFGGAS